LRGPPQNVANISTEVDTGPIQPVATCKRGFEGKLRARAAKIKMMQSAASGTRSVVLVAAPEKIFPTPSLDFFLEDHDFQWSGPSSPTEPLISDLFGFMREREAVHLRRQAGQKQPWTKDPVMRGLRITNVKRINDRTTRLVKSLLDAQKHRWDQPLTPVERHNLVRSYIFNIALWRRFGAVCFIQNMGWRECPQDEITTDALLKEVIQLLMNLWHGGWCGCTDAYNPPKWAHKLANSAWMYGSLDATRSMPAARREKVQRLKFLDKNGILDAEVHELRKSLITIGGAKRAKKVFSSLIADQSPRPFKDLWLKVDSIAESLRVSSQSRQQTIRAIQKVKGYCGTGFAAKEVAEDLAMTPLVKSYCDADTWSVVGPGARRGLNRLLKRELSYKADQDMLLSEMKAIFDMRHVMWPERILGKEKLQLDLHDFQFMLCEFDKYLRAWNKEAEALKRVFTPTL